MALFNNKYLKICKIGEGSFGNVFLVKKVENGNSTSSEPTNQENEKEQEQEEQYFAVKKMKASKNYAENFNEINEIKILSNLAHDNIIAIKDVFYQKEAVHILMEYMCYDLQKLIMTSFEKLTLNHIKTISFQILKGLDYLHKNQIMHRDVKSSNMLFEKSGKLRISDFSISKKITPGQPMTKNIITRFYRPAEIVFGEQNYDFSLDMWSFGCIFAEFFLGTPLFPAETDLDLLGKIFQILGAANEDVWPKCKSLPFFLEYEIKNPVGLENAIPKIQEHKEAFDLLSNLLVLNPEKRLSAEKALTHPFFNINDDFSYCKFLVDEKLGTIFHNTPNLTTLNMNKKNYFPYNDFIQYRSSLILPISGSQISNTFADLRSMVTSFRDVLSGNDKKEINEEKINNDNQKTLSFQNEYNDLYPILSSSVNNTENKSSTGKIEIILSNMQIFLNNNLTEIKDLKSSIDGMIKTQNDNDMNSDETYDFLNNNNNEKKPHFDKTSLLKKSLTDKTSTRQKTSNDPFDEEYIVIQKKIHQKELDKLIDRIKSYEKKNKNLEDELISKKEEQQQLLSELNEHLLVNLSEVSNPIDEETWVNNMDKSEIIKDLTFSPYHICFDLDKLCFYQNLSEKKAEFNIELNFLTDLNLNYIKNDNIVDNPEAQLFNEEEANDLENYKIPHGCLLKNNSNKYIFIKFSSKMDYIKFEGFFLIHEIKRKTKKIDFFLNNIPLNGIISKLKEDTEHLSPSHMRKINLSSAEMEFSLMRSSFLNDKNKSFQNKVKSTEPDGAGLPPNRSSKNKKTLIGKQFAKPDSLNSPFEKSSFALEDQLKNSEKSLFDNFCIPKKNSENFNLEDFSRKDGKKKDSERFMPEDFYKRDNRKKLSENFLKNDHFGNNEKKKQSERLSPDFLPRVEKKKSFFHSKTQNFQDQILSEKKDIDEKKIPFPMDEDENYLKALKTLKNGFVFMKYGKFGKPHERIVYINNSDKAIEWKAFNKKKGKGKIEIDKIVEIKEGKKTPNFLKSKNIDANSDFLAFSIVGKNRGLDLVAENEKIKEKFLSSLKVVREKREEDRNRHRNTGINNFNNKSNNNDNNNNDKTIRNN